MAIAQAQTYDYPATLVTPFSALETEISIELSLRNATQANKRANRGDYGSGCSIGGRER